MDGREGGAGGYRGARGCGRGCFCRGQGPGQTREEEDGRVDYWGAVAESDGEWAEEGVEEGGEGEVEDKEVECDFGKGGSRRWQRDRFHSMLSDLKGLGSCARSDDCMIMTVQRMDMIRTYVLR